MKKKPKPKAKAEEQRDLLPATPAQHDFFTMRTGKALPAGTTRGMAVACIQGWYKESKKNHKVTDSERAEKAEAEVARLKAESDFLHNEKQSMAERMKEYKADVKQPSWKEMFFSATAEIKKAGSRVTELEAEVLDLRNQRAEMTARSRQVDAFRSADGETHQHTVSILKAERDLLKQIVKDAMRGK